MLSNPDMPDPLNLLLYASNVIQEDYFLHPFESAHFDAAVSFQTLHHFSAEKKTRLFSKLYGSLKPGTILTLLILTPGSLVYGHPRAGTPLPQPVQNVMIVGQQTDYCIDATVKCGFEHGFEMIVPAGCNTTEDNAFLAAEKTYRYYNEMMWNRRYARCVELGEAVKLLESGVIFIVLFLYKNST